MPTEPESLVGSRGLNGELVCLPLTPLVAHNMSLEISISKTDASNCVRVRTLRYCVCMRDNDAYDYEGIEAAVAERLKRVCAEMSPDEFDELVRTAALIQWKYEQQRDREARILFNIAVDNGRFAEDQ
jgi:hypothetical protein